MFPDSSVPAFSWLNPQLLCSMKDWPETVKAGVGARERLFHLSIYSLAGRSYFSCRLTQKYGWAARLLFTHSTCTFWCYIPVLRQTQLWKRQADKRPRVCNSFFSPSTLHQEGAASNKHLSYAWFISAKKCLVKTTQRVVSAVSVSPFCKIFMFHYSGTSLLKDSPN